MLLNDEKENFGKGHVHALYFFIKLTYRCEPQRSFYGNINNTEHTKCMD